MSRMIAHLDMDAFFAAIEERDNPRWRGMPIVVGTEPDGGRARGVVSTANYVARTYGIHSALPIGRAWRLAQEAKERGEMETIFLPVEGRRYSAISKQIMAIAGQYTENMEQSSVDEAYLDLSKEKTWKAATETCHKIKREILYRHRLTCSFGLGPNKLVAKIASDAEKPNGLTVVTNRRVTRFLAPLPLRALPGIGPRAEGMLHGKGYTTLGDIQALTEGDLYRLLGEWGLDVYERVRGRHSAPLVTTWTPKSIGEQETFTQDTFDSVFISERLNTMVSDVFRRFKKKGLRSFRRIVLTVRFADFSTYTRSRSLSIPAKTARVIRIEMLRLLLPFFDKRDNPTKKLIRLAGIRIEELQ